jgi:hypothetical protein
MISQRILSSTTVIVLHIIKQILKEPCGSFLNLSLTDGGIFWALLKTHTRVVLECRSNIKNSLSHGSALRLTGRVQPKKTTFTLVVI